MDDNGRQLRCFVVTRKHAMQKVNISPLLEVSEPPKRRINWYIYSGMTSGIIKYYTEAPGMLYNLPFYILTSVPFALRSHDNILIDISEGRRLIIGTASHLPTYQWYYARAYSPHDPRSVRRLSCKSVNNYLPHQWRRRQDLFASQRHCLWYWACH